MFRIYLGKSKVLSKKSIYFPFNLPKKFRILSKRLIISSEKSKILLEKIRFRKLKVLL